MYLCLLALDYYPLQLNPTEKLGFVKDDRFGKSLLPEFGLKEKAMLQQSLLNQVSTKRSWFWLAAIAVICGSSGWMLAPYSSLWVLMGTISIALAVALVRACYQAGFPVWGGLWSLTFGTVFITVETLTSIGAVGWASTILILGAGIFLLEIALRKILAL